MNGWQRLGIVFSVLWLPVGFFWGSAWWVHQTGDPLVEMLKLCAGVINNSDIPKCYRDFGPQYTEAVSGHWWAGVAGAMVPIVLAWLLSWAVIRAGRWVTKGGFR
jgi:hypothetical protein